MPRAFVQSGLPGIGQERFPEQAQEAGRVMAFNDLVQRYTSTGGLDAGGAPAKQTWATSGSAVRGRIDVIGGQGSTDADGDQVSERTTHVISVDPGFVVRGVDRLGVAGRMWAVTALPVESDSSIKRI